MASGVLESMQKSPFGVDGPVDPFDESQPEQPSKLSKNKKKRKHPNPVSPLPDDVDLDLPQLNAPILGESRSWWLQLVQFGAIVSLAVAVHSLILIVPVPSPRPQTKAKVSSPVVLTKPIPITLKTPEPKKASPKPKPSQNPKAQPKTKARPKPSPKRRPTPTPKAQPQSPSPQPQPPQSQTASTAAAPTSTPIPPPPPAIAQSPFSPPPSSPTSTPESTSTPTSTPTSSPESTPASTSTPTASPTSTPESTPTSTPSSEPVLASSPDPFAVPPSLPDIEGFDGEGSACGNSGRCYQIPGDPDVQSVTAELIQDALGAAIAMTVKEDPNLYDSTQEAREFVVFQGKSSELSSESSDSQSSDVVGYYYAIASQVEGETGTVVIGRHDRLTSLEEVQTAARGEW